VNIHVSKPQRARLQEIKHWSDNKITTQKQSETMTFPKCFQNQCCRPESQNQAKKKNNIAIIAY